MNSLLFTALILAGCSARQQSGTVSIPAPPSPPSPAPAPGAPSSTSSPSPSPSSSPSPGAETSKAPAETATGAAAESSEAGGLSSVETTEERRKGLEDKLDASLEEFDGTIQREQEILDERRQASAPAGAGSAEGGEGSGETGAPGSAEAGEGGDPSEAGQENGEAAEGTGDSPDQPAGEPVSTDVGSPEGGSTGAGSDRRVPRDVGDGSDDDVVARQIREAAMNEKDPELREKLWDEYRAYKSGQKKKD
jgi:hypothetical protein